MKTFVFGFLVGLISLDVSGQTAWIEQKTTPSDGTANSEFGSSAAVDGPIAVVGADGENGARGAAYVYAASGGTWSEGQKITADDGAGGDEFGYRLKLEGDTLIVSADMATVGGLTAQGAAYVFANQGGTWNQAQKLTADDGTLFDNFGSSITLDGSAVIIGANGATVGSNPAQGAAYVFTNANDSWTQAQKLTADDGVAYNNFGIAAALRGSIAFVSATMAAIDGNNGQGAVYVFVESNGQWMQTQKLIASDGAAWDQFGMSVAFDGVTAVIGATGNAGAGAAYVFTESNGNWLQTQKLTADDGATGDYFGNTVALHRISCGPSGGCHGTTTVLIGADGAAIDGNTSRGAAYLFTASGGSWSQTHKFVASDGTTDDFFGAALAWDGHTALISTPHPTIGGNSWQGAAYFYTSDTIFADGFDPGSP